MLFRAILYSDTQKRLDETRAAFQREVPKGLVGYYEKSWGSMVERWTFCHRKDLPTLGDVTTDRIKRFFRMLKAAMRDGNRRQGRRMQLGASIRVLMAVVTYKTTIGNFMDYVNTLKVWCLRKSNVTITITSKTFVSNYYAWIS